MNKRDETETAPETSPGLPEPVQSAERRNAEPALSPGSGASSPSAPSGAAQAEGPAAPPPASSSTQNTGPLQELVVEALRTCYDPEIPVNIYELGLIYSIQIEPAGVVNVRMTLTSPMCPVAGTLPPEVEAKIREVPGVASAQVDVVWEPPWSPSMMSEAARLQLNI